MRIKRLDGNKVFVSLSRIDTTASSVTASAHVGVDASSAEAITDLAGERWSKGGEIIGKQIDRQLEKWLQADLRAAHATSDTEKEVANYVVDLTTADGKKAFESLIKLDATKADALAADGPFGPVRAAKQHERVGRARDSLNARLGPVAILSAVDAATETHGTVTTADGSYVYDRARLDDSYTGLISSLWNGERALSRELVSVKRPGESEASRYYHVNFSVKEDDVTSKKDVRRFLALGRLLGAMDDDVHARASDERFLKKLDETDRFADVYFTPEGLADIAQATEADVSMAFARAYEAIETPAPRAKPGWGVGPWIDQGQPGFDKAFKLLKRGPEHSGGNRRGHSHNTRDRRYTRITGRNLRRDYFAMRKLGRLQKLLGELATAPTDASLIAKFAEAKDDLGLKNFWLGLGTIGQLAGAEDVLLNRFEIRDREHDRHLVFASEGAIQDPAHEINRALSLNA